MRFCTTNQSVLVWGWSAAALVVWAGFGGGCADSEGNVPLGDISIEDAAGGGTEIGQSDPDPLTAVCQPCGSDADCPGAGLCVELSDGFFCGVDCSDSLECSGVLECVEIVRGDGEDAESLGFQCLPRANYCIDCPDEDEDGLCDEEDLCAGGDDSVDEDGDGVPDDCDACLNFDDSLDEDDDGEPNACDCGFVDLDCGDMGKCESTPEGPVCVCEQGYADVGEGCVDIDECAGEPPPCSENAECTNTDGWYFCRCAAGYEGDGVTCTEIDGCAGDPCFEGVSCTDAAPPSDGFTCGDCPTGYGGDGITCSDVDGCAGNPCFAGVTCTDVAAPGTGFTCGDCPSGYEGNGITCSDVNGCAGSPCFDGVLCSDIAAPDTGFVCAKCPDGYVGDGITCADFDACAGSPCFMDVACTDLEPPSLDFECGDCPTGYEGDGETCTDVDGCAEEPCADGVVCNDNPAPQEGFTCGACPEGLRDVSASEDPPGTACEDIDECTELDDQNQPLHNCWIGLDDEDNVTVEPACTNTQGGFECGECPDGYTGDGLVGGEATGCTNIDECTDETDECSVHASCADATPTDADPTPYTCTCLPGFEDVSGDDPPGTHCDDIEECAEGPVAAGCDANATCFDTIGSFHCECNDGYTDVSGAEEPPGTTCEDINECDTDNGGCDGNADCINIGGSRLCECHDGFTGDGETCTDIAECDDPQLNDCDELAGCNEEDGGFSCGTCPGGYEDVNENGTLCRDINECAIGTDTCGPNTLCTNTVGSFQCTCLAGFDGIPTSVNGCVDIPECDDPADNDCNDNATCIELVGSYTCDCHDGYSGDGFDTGTGCADVDECDPAAPLHDCVADIATCINEDGGFACQCDAGYTGYGRTGDNAVGCDDIDECALGLDDCDPVADCTNDVGSFSCDCPDGYEDTSDGDEVGTSCRQIDECTELDANENPLHDCPDTADCVDLPGSFVCICLPGYDDINGDGSVCELCSDAFAIALNTTTCDGFSTLTEGDIDAMFDRAIDNVEGSVLSLFDSALFVEETYLLHELFECDPGDDTCDPFSIVQFRPDIERVAEDILTRVFDPVGATVVDSCTLERRLPLEETCNDTTCEVDDDCKSGYECGLDGQCRIVSECIGGQNQCPSGYACSADQGSSGVCNPREFCPNGEACPEGQFCDDGTCTAVCDGSDGQCPQDYVCPDGGGTCQRDCLFERYDVLLKLRRVSETDLYAELILSVDENPATEGPDSANPIDLRLYDGQLSASIDLVELAHALKIVEAVERDAGVPIQAVIPDPFADPPEVAGVLEVDLMRQADPDAWVASVNVREDVVFEITVDSAQPSTRLTAVAERACPAVRLGLDPAPDTLSGLATLSLTPAYTHLGLPAPLLFSADQSFLCEPPPEGEEDQRPDCCSQDQGSCCFVESDGIWVAAACPDIDADGWPFVLNDNTGEQDPVACPFNANGEQYECLPPIGQMLVEVGTSGADPAVPLPTFERREISVGPRLGVVYPVTGKDDEAIRARNIHTGPDLGGPGTPARVGRNCLGFDPDRAVDPHPCQLQVGGVDPTDETLRPLLIATTTTPFGFDVSRPDGRTGAYGDFINSIDGQLEASIRYIDDRTTDPPELLIDETIGLQWNAPVGLWPNAMPAGTGARLEVVAQSPAPIHILSGQATLSWLDAAGSGRQLVADASAAPRCVYGNPIDCATDSDCNGDGVTTGPDVGCDGDGCVCDLSSDPGTCDPNHALDGLYVNRCPAIYPITPDTTVDGADPTDNSAAKTLRVGGRFGPLSQDRYRIVGGMDLTGLPSSPDPSFAFIELYALDSRDDLEGSLELHRMGTWSPEFVRWGSTNLAEPLWATEDFTEMDRPGWHPIEALDAVTYLRDHALEGFFIANRGGAVTFGTQRFHSADSPDVTRRPHVIVGPPRPPRLGP